MLCAVLAAAESCSIAQAQRAGEPDDQTALAVPRMGVRGAPGVALPQPLTPSEATLVRRIFALQANGGMAEAARETGRLDNGLLLGAILANRYLSHAYSPSPTELKDWLARFGDEPDAQAIEALLGRAAPGPAPETSAGRKSAGPAQARALFLRNRDAEAVAAASRLLPGAQAGDGAAEGLLAGGLSAWRLDAVPTARELFEAAYDAAANGSLRASSAYWAARAAQRQHDRAGSVVWLRRAAEEDDRFYAAIARRALGPAAECVSGGTIGEADVEAVLGTPAGRRALALLQVGEKRLAEAELRALWLDVRSEPVFGRALLLVARAVGLRQLSAMIEQDYAVDRAPETAALAELRPNGGFLVDPALVYALVRHESNFHAAAVSHSGARGLMQIKPVTARAVGAGSGYLHDPGENLAVGQRFMMMLAADESVDGDLIRLLAGYGQGLYALKRWVDGVRDAGDPLLFIEAMPDAKSRHFVEDALAYSWHYAGLLGLPATSLDALAAGRFPRLMQADGGRCARAVAGR
jgi:soluble lytic murein transglycosylase-like protein